MSTKWLNPERQRKRRRSPEHLRPVPETPLRYHQGKLQQECVVTRYDLETGRQESQTVEWRDVE